MSPSRLAFPSTNLGLLAGVQALRTEAWEAFFHRYQPVLRRWCARHGLPADACDDLTQDLLLSLPRKLRSYHRESDDGGVNRFRCWLRAVVRHAATDHIRRRDHRFGDVGFGGEDNPLHDHAVVDELEAELIDCHHREVMAVVAAVRRSVTPDTWAIYEQVKLLDFAPSDVAGRYNRTVTAVYLAIHRVNRKLRAEYQRLGGLGPQEGADESVCLAEYSATVTPRLPH